MDGRSSGRISHRAATALFAMAGLGLGTDCLAVEGGLGHTITGLQVTPFAGIIPPDPGFI